MTTICTQSVPAAEVGLGETLQDISDAQVASESVVASSSPASQSLLRARAPDRQQLDAAFDADPSVAEWTRVTGEAPRWLYWIEWAGSVSLAHQMLTGARAVILSAFGSGREWTLRVLYPSREVFSQIYTVCTEHNLSLTIDAIRTVDGAHSMQHGLTDAQYTALVQAYEMGYFTVPREVDLQTVADELAISHQALSERLRRAHKTLIETTLYRQGTPADTAPAERAAADEALLRDSQPLLMD